MYNPKYRKGQHKESKEARRARNKAAKASKYDPALKLTTREEKRRKEAEDAEMSDDEDSSEQQLPQDGDMETEEESPPSSFSTSDEANDPSLSKIEQLRAKLRAKLEEKRANLPGGKSQSATMVSKRAARRAEKQKRIELAKKKKNASSGSTKTGKTKNDRITIVTKELGGSKITSSASSKLDDLAGIDFGGIAGLKETDKNYSDANKSLKNMGKKKSLERLLEEAEAKKKRLKELKASNATEDKEKAKKIEWGDALKAASGENGKEADPLLLKKAIKRKAKKKAKSQEAWKSRMEQAKEKMDERQKIRSHNIGKRALGGAAGANLSKKRIAEDETEADDKEGKKKKARLGPHSGKSRPGFEGKKQDFINKGGKSNNNIASQ